MSQNLSNIRRNHYTRLFAQEGASVFTQLWASIMLKRTHQLCISCIEDSLNQHLAHTACCPSNCNLHHFSSLLIKSCWSNLLQHQHISNFLLGFTGLRNIESTRTQWLRLNIWILFRKTKKVPEWTASTSWWYGRTRCQIIRCTWHHEFGLLQ